MQRNQAGRLDLPVLRAGATRAPRIGAALDRLGSLEQREELLGEFATAAAVQLERQADDVRAGSVESARAARLDGLGEHHAEGLCRKPVSQHGAELLPLGVIDERPGEHPVEVLDRAAARLGARELKEAEVAQQSDVVADRRQRAAEPARELDRARLAGIADRLQDAQAQRMPERLEEVAIKDIFRSHRHTGR